MSKPETAFSRKFRNLFPTLAAFFGCGERIFRREQSETDSRSPFGRVRKKWEETRILCIEKGNGGWYNISIARSLRDEVLR